MKIVGRNLIAAALVLALLSPMLTLKTVVNTLQPCVYSPQDIPTYNLGKISQNFYVEFQVQFLTTNNLNDFSILLVQLLRSQDHSIHDSSSDKCSGTKCIHRFFIGETDSYSLSFYALKDVIHEEIIPFQIEARVYEIDAPEKSVTLLKFVDVIRSNPINYIFLAKQREIAVTYSGAEVEQGNSLITYALHKDTNLNEDTIQLDAKTSYKTGSFVEHYGSLDGGKVMHFRVTLPAGFYVLIYMSASREGPLKVSYQTDPFICPFSPEYLDKARIFGGCLWELPNSCSDSSINDTDCDSPVPLPI